MPQGSYDLLRFNVTKIVIGNVTYLEPAKWYVPVLTAYLRTPYRSPVDTDGVFRIAPGSVVVADISLMMAFPEQIIADSGYLKPCCFVVVYY